MAVADPTMLRDALVKLFEEHTPTNGRCRGCGGRVVQQVIGLYRGRYICSPPACGNCERVYLFAKHTPVVGAQEFMRQMSQPVTI